MEMKVKMFEYSQEQLEEIVTIKDFYTHLHSEQEKVAVKGNEKDIRKQAKSLLEGMKKYKEFFGKEIKELEGIVNFFK